MRRSLPSTRTSRTPRASGRARSICRHGRRWGIVAAILSLAAPAAHAGLPVDNFYAEKIVAGARAHGMAAAYTAIAEGPFAAWWNPGALAQTPGLLLSPYARPQYEGLRLVSVDRTGETYGLTYAANGFGIGAYYGRFKADWYYNSDPLHEDDVFLLGVGVDLADRLRSGRPGAVYWGLGANLKRMSFERREPGFHIDGSVYDADLGMLFTARFPLRQAPGGEPGVRPGSWWGVRAGAGLRSLLESKADLGRGFESDTYRSLRAGVALEAATREARPYGPGLQATLAAEVETDFEEPPESTCSYCISLDTDPAYRFGFEARALRLLAARVGYIEDSTGPSEIHDWTWGLGLGWDLPGGSAFSVDWARVPQWDGAPYYNHYALEVRLPI